MEKVIEGVLPVAKSSGVLSAKVVNRVKKVLKREGIIAKVGHGGTLDKFASGLILVLLGRATKLFERIKSLPKLYVATVKFGEVRTTDDINGEVLKYYPVSDITRKSVEDALMNFEGEILQVPPAFSAVHINGQRAYQIAKKDYYRALKFLKPKRVIIYDIRLLDFYPQNLEAKIFVKCSGGTYIRALARDLGQILGIGAFLKELKREAIGNVSLDSAIPFYELSNVDSITANIISIGKFIKLNNL
ncbi:MAG: tRNA pseudouridine(55) synthase TruB [Brevinematia bacterium]